MFVFLGTLKTHFKLTPLDLIHILTASRTVIFHFNASPNFIKRFSLQYLKSLFHLEQFLSILYYL